LTRRFEKAGGAGCISKSTPDPKNNKGAGIFLPLRRCTAMRQNHSFRSKLRRSAGARLSQPQRIECGEGLKVTDVVGKPEALRLGQPRSVLVAQFVPGKFTDRQSSIANRKFRQPLPPKLT
jgi:hypothetical protein